MLSVELTLILRRIKKCSSARARDDERNLGYHPFLAVCTGDLLKFGHVTESQDNWGSD